MKNLFFHSVLIFVLSFAHSCLLAQGSEVEQASDALLTTIAFGSCAREREPQPVWQDIIAQQPQLLLLLGDNHYADFWKQNGRMVMKPVPNAERIREAYEMLASKPGFAELKKNCQLMATWDDHDYGANDKGNDFELRKASQNEFVRFFDFKPEHPIHRREGVYHSALFGPPGKRVQVIMLDTRYHRDPLVRAEDRVRGKGPYRPTTDTKTTVLGEAQWQWLDAQLRQPADLRIIGSSIQVVADEHRWETWGNFPHERSRLYRLIAETQANGVVFISGDRHLMEISCDDSRGVSYPMWDFTSSGLTQKKQKISEANAFRVGPVKREQNFGVLRIEWKSLPASPRVHLEGYGENGVLLTRQTLLLNSLRAK